MKSMVLSYGVYQMSKAPDTKQDDFIELVDGEKINFTINGRAMDELDDSADVEPEFFKDNIDYSKYENLTAFFVEGLRKFSHFVSLNIPDKFKKKTPREHDMHSSRNGIKAMKVCITLLEKQLKTGESGYKRPDDFNHLHEWYVSSMIDFMHITMGDYPKEMNDPDDPDHAVKSAISAFKNVRKQLLNYIKEQTGVK